VEEISIFAIPVFITTSFFEGTFSVFITFFLDDFFSTFQILLVLFFSSKRICLANFFSFLRRVRIILKNNNKMYW